MIMGTVWSKGIGDRYEDPGGEDFKKLVGAYGQQKQLRHNAYDAFKDAVKAGDQFSTTADDGKSEDKPMDRIKAAFDSLKNLHKSPDEQRPDFESFNWPQGPIGAPSTSMASAPTSVPMPLPRPAEAPMQQPVEQPGPLMSLFQRSAAMQRDPSTGDFIDPAAAAKAQPGIFHGLFG